ncbi:MAG: DUF1223 domain-containing protein [Sulfuritalea sp.]|nr:DUF1223 domain-containing protein [Sulfuritalea sp.]
MSWSHAGYAGRIVPPAFHVDYWDRLGWVDRFARPCHTQRQQIALEADWKRVDLGVAAFVQDKASGEIVQALQRHTCSG